MKRILTITALAALVSAVGCTNEQEVVSRDLGIDGTCVLCHAGLSSGQVHPTFKLRCVDCHGGNDEVAEVSALAEARGLGEGETFDDPADFRDPDLLALSHVLPKKDTARFFYANGIDDDGDGIVDEGPQLDNNFNPTTLVNDDPGEIAEPGIGGEGMGEFFDTELNRDLNYTRWLNPGDLRVATVGCGSGNRLALDGEGGTASGGCHQGVVDTMRRSIMVNNAAVINGAYYGNESWRGTFQNAQDPGLQQQDRRSGAFGYVLDFETIDGCIDTSLVDADAVGGRAQPVFDTECLERDAAMKDPNAADNAPGNEGVFNADLGREEEFGAFEATQGVITPAPQIDPGNTIAHEQVFKTRFPEWGGKPIDPRAQPLPQLQHVPDEDLLDIPGIPDAVDNILRGFRAYYPLNYPGSAFNFFFTFGTNIRPEFDRIKTNNPFGRGHSSGCTGCHMLYNYDGSRDPQVVIEELEGGIEERVIEDPTTKHREFDPENQDTEIIDGQERLVGVAVRARDREFVARAGADREREQQRYYSKNHELTTRITTQQCGLCHAFVTRIDFAYQGIAEDEQRQKLARFDPIRFTTPAGTSVIIRDSWVREECREAVDADCNNNPDAAFELIKGDPEARNVIELAKQRDADLAQAGFIAGNGGCGQETFTEDCNNNGELDTALTLEHIDANGVLVTQTINEDLNGNGQLDLIDRVPREISVDGRQNRYIYGGANGSTRLVDIHFERGMHCIDCHFIQDAHGDGNIWHTNWELIEIECEDCHGTRDGAATLFTTGATGGNDLTKAFDHDGKPFFERKDGVVIQRSRVTPGLFWEVPQVPDTFTTGHPDFNERAVQSHIQGPHMPDVVAPGEHTQGSTFAGEPGKSEMTNAKLECYSCHMSWIHNCLGCHYSTNLGDLVRKKMNPDGSIVAVAGENETWFNNKNQAGASNFQLLTLMRGPFVLGANADADGQRLAPFRSSMQLYVGYQGGDGSTLFNDIVFTTHQPIDANSGRTNMATSGSAMNQTMPHTVRPEQTRDCDWCHALVDDQGRVRNDHILGETFGVGSGRLPQLGDWVYIAGAGGAAGGLEIIEYKQENQFPGSTGSSRFPGIIVNPLDTVAANVEPLFDGTAGVGAGFVGTDVAFVTNWNDLPAQVGATQPPTLRDLAITTLSNGTAGRLMLTDVTFRGHPALATRPSVGDDDRVFVLPLPDVALGLATLSPDLADPYVYIANGAAGLTVVKIRGILIQVNPGQALSLVPDGMADAAEVVNTVALNGNKVATEVKLVGDLAYVGTDDGNVQVFDMRDAANPDDGPENPEFVTEVSVGGGRVHSLEMLGAFVLLVGTDNGVAALDVSDLTAPKPLTGADDVIVVPGIQAFGLYPANGHAYVAAGTDGLLDIDMTTPASPDNLGNMSPQAIDARDVVVSEVPGQRWVIAADASAGGAIVYIKVDLTQGPREKCMPDPIGNGCGLDTDFRDPTVLGRDPSFDPVAGDFIAEDPSGAPFARVQTNLVVPRRLARPPLLERLGTQTGRRIRDSFMPGSTVMSTQVMQRMYEYQVCEAPGTDDVDGNGLGELGFFRGPGQPCVPFFETAVEDAEPFQPGATDGDTAEARRSAWPVPGQFRTKLMRKARELRIVARR